jgi:sarcosine oxidase
MVQYDVIVLGTGGVGSAALYHLAQRGVRVLGIDRFPAAHDRGSSHGQTRLIRLAYFEHSNYVPLVRLAYSLWSELGKIRDEHLFHRTGLIYFSPSEGPVVEGLLHSAQEHQLDLEELTPSTVGKNYPGFVVPRDATVVFERGAGYLWVEKCIRAQIEEAIRGGAEHRLGETVLSWAADAHGVTVKTNRETYQGGHLVITLGPWAQQLLGPLGVRFRILRKHMHWFAVEDPHYQAGSGCPCFFYDVNAGNFYGFPAVDPYGLKIAEHSGGTEISNPLEDRRELEPFDLERINALRQEFLPGVSGKRNRHEVCFYTMSPDGQFIVDRHPAYDHVVFAAGLSGHGFKFTSALGRVLAELCLDGTASVNVDFLRLDRPGLAGC